MKAVLKFDLDDPNDIISHKRCVKSLDMACVLFEIQSNLKRSLEHRYEAADTSLDYFFVLYEVFMEIGKLMEEHNINLEEIIE